MCFIYNTYMTYIYIHTYISQLQKCNQTIVQSSKFSVLQVTYLAKSPENSLLLPVHHRQPKMRFLSCRLVYTLLGFSRSVSVSSKVQILFLSLIVF